MYKTVFFLLILSSFFLSKINAQQIVSNINSVDSLMLFLNENENDRETFTEINTDGEIIKRKKILGLFKITLTKGGFAETYLLKDSVLSKVTVGKREYLNRKKTESTNTIENFIFSNEILCYFNEIKYLESENESDSLLYEVTYYIENGNLLKFYSKGNFRSDSLEYMDKVIANSQKFVEYKKYYLLDK